MSEFLKCDATGCDHLETVESITGDMVGKPCPKCGANLLTQNDWDHYERVFRPYVDTLTELGLIQGAKPGDAGVMRVGFHEGEYTFRLPVSTPQPNADEGDGK